MALVLPEADPKTYRPSDQEDHLHYAEANACPVDPHRGPNQEQHGQRQDHGADAVADSLVCLVDAIEKLLAGDVPDGLALQR